MKRIRSLAKELADCFHDCGRFMMYDLPDGDDNVMMSHGIVTNPDGKQIEHAWIEKEGDVLDLANNFMMDKEKYYEYFDIEKVKKYNKEETMVNMLKNKHWGPW